MWITLQKRRPNYVHKVKTHFKDKTIRINYYILPTQGGDG